MKHISKTVLIVDDSALVRAYYRSILEEIGLQVQEALNGVEALERLLTTAIDLLIVDVNMPQMNGLEFLQQVRQKEGPVASIPALIASTQSHESDFEAARAAGANFYLLKPIGRERLAQLAAILCGAQS